ncbi:MAG: hypothetical protein KDI82_02750 [Gammaproteobacteria bacterium]|nr:hypothetical protein [Gammaproteobacteria bacterium]
MAQVGLRIAIWVLVLGIAYFAFGPKLFDSSGDGNPFTSDKALYLPPEKPQALRDFERLAGQRDLSDSEQADYLAAMQAYQGIFWRAEGTTIEQALAGFPNQRRERLIDILRARGLSPSEINVFFMVLNRDHPDLLDDRG